MRHKELTNLYIKTEHGEFSPIYTCTGYTPIYENENILDYELIDYIQTMTAEEHYQHWLDNKEKRNKPIEEDKIQIRLDQQEQALGILATQVAKNTLLQNGGI